MTTKQIDEGLMAQLLKEAADEHARLHGHEDHDWVPFYAEFMVKRLAQMGLKIGAK